MKPVHAQIRNSAFTTADLIAATRKELKAPSPLVEETMGAAGVALATTVQFGGGSEQLHSLGERIIHPLFLKTTPSGEVANKLGRALGKHELSALLSLSGSLPGLILSTLATVQGLRAQKKLPHLALAYLGFGVANHAYMSIEPWKAALMSAANIEKAAEKGHDFANIAVQLHNMTGISVKAAAIGGAALWTAIIPTLILAWALRKQTTETNIISDFAALKYWLEKAGNDEETKNQFTSLIEKYDGKLDNLDELNHFAVFLIENLPKSQLDEIKKEIIHEAKKSHHSSRTERIIAKISLGGSMGYMASRVVYIATQIFFPAAKGLMKVSLFSTPVVAVLSLASDFYTAYQDGTNQSLPKKVRMISVAKLICNVVSTTVFVAAIFTPGLNLLALGVYAVSLVALVALSSLRNHYLQRHIEMQDAIQEDQFNFMIQWSKVRNKQSESQKYVGLTRWEKRVKEARNEGLLSKEQLEKLDALPKPSTYIEELKQRFI